MPQSRYFVSSCFNRSWFSSLVVRSSNRGDVPCSVRWKLCILRSTSRSFASPECPDNSALWVNFCGLSLMLSHKISLSLVRSSNRGEVPRSARWKLRILLSTSRSFASPEWPDDSALWVNLCSLSITLYKKYAYTFHI